MNDVERIVIPDYGKFKAVFEPEKQDDLRPEIKKFIGQTLEFSYAWMMDEDDMFPNEAAYSCHADGFHYWVPEHDIRRV